MVKISGLDKLTKQLADAQKAIAELGGPITDVQFNPYDPASINAALLQVDAEIDNRVGKYSNNPIVKPLIEEAKANFRQAILDKAAKARLESDPNELS